MRISIVGIGEVGTYYAKHWNKAGHEIVLTYFRDQKKAEAFIKQLGKNVSLLSPREAVQNTDVILFCPRFEYIEDAANQIGDVGNVILIDPNNPFNPKRTGRADIPSDLTAFQMMLTLFPQARHVKAFHNLGVQRILEYPNHQLVAFIASDDMEAANIGMQLAREAHLTPLLTGRFDTSALSEFPGTLFGIPFTTIEEANEALKKAINSI